MSGMPIVEQLIYFDVLSCCMYVSIHFKDYLGLALDYIVVH